MNIRQQQKGDCIKNVWFKKAKKMFHKDESFKPAQQTWWLAKRWSLRGTVNRNKTQQLNHGRPPRTLTTEIKGTSYEQTDTKVQTNKQAGKPGRHKNKLLFRDWPSQPSIAINKNKQRGGQQHMQPWLTCHPSVYLSRPDVQSWLCIRDSEYK